MMKLFFFAVLVSLALAEFTHLEYTQPIDVPSEWVAVADQPIDDHVITMMLAVKQHNMDTLSEIFNEVSDPRSPKYGKHKTLDEIVELTAASEDEYAILLVWLEKIGATILASYPSRDYIKAEITVAKAKVAFNTEFSAYSHPDLGMAIKALHYSVPSNIAGLLDFVTGLVGFPNAPRKVIVDQLGAPNPRIGPKELRQRYNVTTFGGNKKNSQAVAEFQGQYYSQKDLDTFFKKYVTEPSNANSTVDRIIGKNGVKPGIEANLDIQYIMGVAPNTPTWFYSNPSLDFWADLTAWIAELANDANTPYVHSISYGDQAKGPSDDYKKRLNEDFQKLGTRGRSIIFASGDSGTGCGGVCSKFEPSFPATSPYVTSVGATRFTEGGVGPEAAVESFKSGGGFSWDFDMPDYQKDAVEHFLSTSPLPPSRFFNAKGRCTPDVAALGIGFNVVDLGRTISIGGTSASAPTFAAIVSLLNEKRLSDNKPTLGFLNPWIYQVFAQSKTAFYDVTTGSNPDGCCSEYSFKCAVGYDAITGVGTPNFPELVKFL